jgi:hypothetical protein
LWNSEVHQRLKKKRKKEKENPKNQKPIKQKQNKTKHTNSAKFNKPISPNPKINKLIQSEKTKKGG